MKRPIKPPSYELRKQRGTKKDLEIIKKYNDEMALWLKKVNERKFAMSDTNKIVYPKFQITIKQIVDLFLKIYKKQNKGKEFKMTNGNSNEPEQYLHTLILYFLKQKKFFESHLLTKLSEPSFDKGLLTIGGYGNGKSTIWNALIKTFDIIIKEVEKDYYSNRNEIIKTFKVNRVVSNEIVEAYNTAKQHEIKELFMPLKSMTQLYIDDIMREQDAFNFGRNNIFLGVLTNRADKGFITHLTLNYGINEDESFKNINETLFEFSTRYDRRVYDRIFGNYNIIELKGGTFRK